MEISAIDASVTFSSLLMALLRESICCCKRALSAASLDTFVRNASFCADILDVAPRIRVTCSSSLLFSWETRRTASC
eukprot:CAMPEP_0179337920 /NCGR_PEP_ID=MMETSP0797-20121207/67899_1 /TAXON_ID=47934 /ORGANISM="Dinophysis acuminata, Strain DAEP01" /LENGTH=76 /DNA_ID=CAMNT_0021051637 /DNA_START=283 /DNA_END=510 /DNA_ORIENTATION=+